MNILRGLPYEKGKVPDKLKNLIVEEDAKMRANAREVRTKSRLLASYFVNPKGCWVWTKCIDKDGYGVMRFNSESWRVPRLAMRLLKPTEFNPDLNVLHICDCARCFNPEHLYQGTHADNMQDRLKRGHNPEANKKYCPQGHDYTPENTYVGPDGHRECRTCMRAKSRFNYYNQSLKGILS